MYRLKTIITTFLLTLTFYAGAQQRMVVTYRTVSADNRPLDIEAFLFESVDEQPHFPGGDGAMMKFINRERQYPAQAYRQGIEGRVLCSFVVKPDGAITAPEVVRGVREPQQGGSAHHRPYATMGGRKDRRHKGAGLLHHSHTVQALTPDGIIPHAAWA